MKKECNFFFFFKDSLVKCTKAGYNIHVYRKSTHIEFYLNFKFYHNFSTKNYTIKNPIKVPFK